MHLECIFEKKSNYRRSEKESHESLKKECNLSGKKVSYFGIISNNVIMKICLVLFNHIVQYTSYRSQKYKSPSPYYDDKYPR